MPSPASLEARVQRSLQRERRVLRSREHLGLAIHRAGGGERDSRHVLRPHRLEHGRGGDRVLLQILARALEAVTNVRIGLKVEYPVAALERSPQKLFIEHVAFVKGDPRILQQLGDELVATGAEVVDDHHLGAGRTASGQRAWSR